MSALHLHFEPVMYTFRGYAAPGGFEEHRPYDLVGSVFILGEGRARVFATMGELDAETVRALAKGLAARGVDTVLINRHGVEQVWKYEGGRLRAAKG